MNRSTTLHQKHGYILQEIVVGFVIFAIAMLPLMRAFRMLPQMGAAIGEQSRREAWRSAADQAILQGVDPSQTPVMHRLVDQPATGAMRSTVARHDLPTRVGAPQITVLCSLNQDTAEDRGISAGFEIGPGIVVVPPRIDPLPPLPLIKLSVPLLNPLSGTMVPVLSLTPSALPNAPFVLTLRAQGPDSSNLVQLRTTAPEVHEASGLGAASAEINAVELAQSVRGRAWAEFAGNAATDIPVVLVDGRTRWLIRDAGRTQVYEPSDAIEFVLGLDLGRPSYSIGGVEHASGETVAIDYAQALSIDAGKMEAVIKYSAETRARFGDQWNAVEPSFSWSFGSHPGDSSAGNTASFFRPEGRALWASSQTLSATPIGLAGMRPLAGSWTIQRQTTVLEPPERVASFYDAAMDAAGWLDFNAPLISALKSRVGRPEVNGVESVGNSLSVLVVP